MTFLAGGKCDLMTWAFVWRSYGNHSIFICVQMNIIEITSYTITSLDFCCCFFFCPSCELSHTIFFYMRLQKHTFRPNRIRLNFPKGPKATATASILTKLLCISVTNMKPFIDHCKTFNISLSSYILMMELWWWWTQRVFFLCTSHLISCFCA